MWVSHLAVVHLLDLDLPRQQLVSRFILSIESSCRSEDELICYSCCIRLWVAWFGIARGGMVHFVNVLKVLMPCVENSCNIKVVARGKAGAIAGLSPNAARKALRSLVLDWTRSHS